MSLPDDEKNSAKAGFIEQARNKELTRKLADLQEQVVMKMLALSNQDPERFDYIGGYRGEKELWFFTEGAFQGIDEVRIGLIHSFLGSEENFAKVGVQTPTSVSLGLYTDRGTWEEVRQHDAYDWEERFGLTLDEVKELIEDTFTIEEVDDMTFPGAASSDRYGTYYFVDKAGNFAKAVSLPDELAEGRKDLQIEGPPVDGTVSVQVPMMARDFVLMKIALEIVNRKVDQELHPA